MSHSCEFFALKNVQPAGINKMLGALPAKFFSEGCFIRSHESTLKQIATNGVASSKSSTELGKV